VIFERRRLSVPDAGIPVRLRLDFPAATENTANPVLLDARYCDFRPGSHRDHTRQISQQTSHRRLQQDFFGLIKRRKHVERNKDNP
jgi:hypothetical protein